MNVGKAIYYLLSNATSVTDIAGTRIYPELAEQEAATPYAVYQIVSVNPDDTNDGPAVIDEVSIDVLCVADSYNEAADLATATRAALDRVRGTYNGVNVESIQYDSTDSDVQDSPRRYEQTVTLTVRVFRDAAQIATGQNIDQLTLGRLYDVTDDATTGQVIIKQADGTWAGGDAAGALGDLTDVSDAITTDAIDRQGLVYDETTGEWIAGGVSQTTIPIRNSTQTQLNKGAVVAFAGNQGDRILVEAWDNASASAYIVGVLDANLAGGADGHAVSYGEVRALDTSAYTLNDVLYANTGGTFTTVSNSLPIATVTRVHATTGRIFVRTYVPGDHYRDRYRAEASAKVDAASLAAGETVETYYTAQADGDAFYRRKLGDTAKNAGDVVRRTYYYKRSSFGDVNTTGYTEVVMDDDSTHDELIAAIQTYLNTNSAPLTVWSKRAEVTPAQTLLDEFPGAAVALSAARLVGNSSTYTGPLINVRRASDNAAQDIGFDGEGELDRLALATFCAGTDGFIVRWYDQSGNGNDGVQATTANQPKIYDSVTGVIDSVRFDGVNDYLQTTYSNANNYTAFWVQVPTDGVGGQVIGRGDLASRHVAGWTSANAAFFYRQGSAAIQATGAAVKYLGYILSQPSSSDCRVGYNGSTGTTTANIGTGTLEDMVIGAERAGSSLYGQSDIYEIILYPSNQSTNRASIEANIATFYGITI